MAMKLDNIKLTLGILELASIITIVVMTVQRCRQKINNEKSTGEDTLWIAECLDGLIADIKKIEKRLAEQDKAIKKLEKLILAVKDCAR